MSFNDETNLNVVIDREVLEGHYLKSALIPLIAIIICSMAYGLIIRTVRNHSIRTSHKDIRLSVQVIGLLVALLVTCVHFCTQYYLNYNKMTSWIYAMRYYTPLWVGLLTFINPWMIIIMNTEVRQLTLGRKDTRDYSSGNPAFIQTLGVNALARKPSTSQPKRGI
ncbi:unnamed protein product [Strongylus vulgaris]|uniref:Uncharacterized protein n=1 Tax=Strongylus vulgaris TaxID=40348 RepID=A0A3P7JJG7_STRVU|nr:unnamed protein product [Strongylus vulgaris]